MNKIWKVERNTGSVAYLVDEHTTVQVKRPDTMSRQAFFEMHAPGNRIHDEALRSKFTVVS